MKTIRRITLKTLKKISILFISFILMTAVLTTAIVQFSGDSEFVYPKENDLIVNDITQLNPITVSGVIRPITSKEISDAILNSTGPISIGGGRFSMGGQVAYKNSLHIDMRSFNKVLNFDEESKAITVQTGVTWRDIQEYIDPYDLSVRIMQTYSNFTVGGSLSVNVHGRYIGEGPLIKSVNAIKIILANGDEITASRDENADIFYSAIGGYGGIGVITEATLALTDNSKIERITTLLDSGEYPEHFKKNIRDNSNVVFSNGDLYPPDYDQVLDVSWYKTEKPLTITDRLIPRNETYKWGPMAAEFVANYNIGKSIRKNIIDPIYYSFDRVVWRNWEASYDVRELEPKNRLEKTYVLREYFIPVAKYDEFVPLMKDIFVSNDANIINVSIRHAHAAADNYLSWAREEVFAFVVYYQQGVDDAAKQSVEKWSVEMIDAVNSVGGTYYLPYQIFASEQQFKKAYPNADKFFAIKSKYDPDNRFTNQLWKKHYPKQNSVERKKASIKQYYRGEEQTVLTIPEWYLVFNPLEYAEYLEKGNNPSNFPFISSVDEYWKLYDRSVAVSQKYNTDNSQYMTMLQVIGVSTTVEFMYKSFYENTIGRLTWWLTNENATQEDKIIAMAHRAYSDLIFLEAWYKFDFSSWVCKIWTDTSFLGESFIRKTERKIFFTLEFGFKSLYAKLIGFASQTAYEPSDGLIYLDVNIPSEAIDSLPEHVTVLASDESSNSQLISIPRWGIFTETLPKLLSMNITINDISGNTNIVVTYITPKNRDTENMGEKLFDSRLVTDDTMTRRVKSLNVSALNDFLTELKHENFRLEHIYDY